MINLPLPDDNFEGYPKVASIGDFVKQYGDRILSEPTEISSAVRHMEHESSTHRPVDTWGHMGRNIASAVGHSVETPVIISTPQQTAIEPVIAPLEYVATPVPHRVVNAPVSDIDAARARLTLLHDPETEAQLQAQFQNHQDFKGAA